MESIWPWLAVAGLGALHGLNPASGWMWVAAWGVRSSEPALALLGLVPIAAGHVASMALTGIVVVYGFPVDHMALMVVTAALCTLTLALHLWRRAPARARAPAGHMGLTLWSFMMSTAHGSGLMLVPALLPLCVGDAAGREPTASALLMPAFAAVGVHTAAMLAVTGAMAAGACRSMEAGAQLMRGWSGRSACP